MTDRNLPPGGVRGHAATDSSGEWVVFQKRRFATEIPVRVIREDVWEAVLSMLPYCNGPMEPERCPDYLTRDAWCDVCDFRANVPEADPFTSHEP